MSVQLRAFSVWAMASLKRFTRKQTVSIDNESVRYTFDRAEIDLRSVLVAASATGAVLGIESHIWYGFLDRFIAQANWRNVFKKVAFDQTIAAPIYTCTYILGK
jgi:hypothetical protein